VEVMTVNFSLLARRHAPPAVAIRITSGTPN
jgi:hypothetical protein